MESSSEAQQQREPRHTEHVRDMGAPGGLFRCCMDEIQVQHTLGQRLRSIVLAAGLMTDALCYAELLAQFYVATAALEDAMDRLMLRHSKDENDDNDDGARLVRAVHALGYRLKPLYEADLVHLFGIPANDATVLAACVHKITSVPAAAYAARLHDANARELVAAAFILLGPLVIGGGAALKPRVCKAFGEGATHVFSPVVGIGRAQRRDEFIKCYDELLLLLKDAEEARAAAVEIVAVCGECMTLNNNMMMALQRRPWWSNLVWVGLAAAGAAVAYRLLLYKK